MSLTNEDRNVLKQLHLDKAHACLIDGEQLLKMESVSAAANRFYYAVFHAIHALFVANGIQTKSHRGTNVQFHQHFIQTGLIDPKFGHFVALMENMREKADYDVIYDVTREDLEALKPIVYELIQKIELLLKEL
ncbi:MAG: HEPN domain-containing protein [Paludibacteraceae bacterium]|nr:HEPN domain-containing protein [Paludibacteraceae bacterium]